jgi:hypothetical protein
MEAGRATWRGPLCFFAQAWRNAASLTLKTILTSR